MLANKPKTKILVDGGDSEETLIVNELGFHQPGGVEERLGYHVGQLEA
jgi:hypothetical protein